MACEPVVAAAVMTVVPDGVGTVALNAPVASATVATTVVGFAVAPGCPADTSTVAPGVVVPVTVVVAPLAIDPADGDVIVTPTSEGGPGLT